jgi:hypothetical protein
MWSSSSRTGMSLSDVIFYMRFIDAKIKLIRTWNCQDNAREEHYLECLRDLFS